MTLFRQFTWLKQDLLIHFKALLQSVCEISHMPDASGLSISCWASGPATYSDPTDHWISAARLWACTVYDWMAAPVYRWQGSFWIWPQPNWELVLRQQYIMLSHWLSPCTQNECEDHSTYGSGQYETVLQSKLSLIGWFHTQNDLSACQ